MTDKKRVIDARADADGDITQVRLEGNKRWTSVERAMKMADAGKLENAHTVHSNRAKDHLRTNPDRSKGNNLDTWAGDV